MGREAIERSTSAEAVGADAVTRRQALKRLGVGAAIAWSAPVLSSVKTPAFAQDNGTPRCAGVDRWRCGDEEVECGSGGPFEFCFCTVDMAGNEVCIEDHFCFGLEPCDSNADCPDGHVCVPETCCFTPVCLPLCSNAGAAGIGSMSLQSLDADGGTRASGRR